jgi:putative DNA primase/helicase
MTTCRSDEQGAATAALELARRGWPILPLRGKVPRLHNGLHGATTDERAIANWWRLWPDCGIGVRTGNGITVLDVDGDTGADSLHDLERQHFKLPTTVTVMTGGGGAHYYFGADGIPNSVGKLGPGLDVRGTGGYVVVPPTIHPETGRAYEWDNHPADVPVQPMPAWLFTLLQADASAVRRRTPTREWVRLIRGIPEGERNDSLARLCGHLLARGVDEHVMLELLLAVNQARCRPPLPHREILGIAESILRRHLRNLAA